MDPNLTTPVRNKHLHNAINIPSSPFMQNLGYGTGTVVYCMHRSPTVQNSYRSPWAIKKITIHSKSDDYLAKRLKQEAAVLKKLSHDNIVGFRGFIYDAKGEKCLAMEDCEKSLGSLIEERYETEMPMFEPHFVMKVANDIASALEYLHNTALILHCDVKSFNILVKGDFEICKLCDFGSSMPSLKDGRVDESKFDEDVEYVGTPSWCPREILQYPSIITDRADIYALGLVLWEMLALSTPPLPHYDNSDLMDDLMNRSDLDSSITVHNNHSRPDLPEVDFSKEYFYILQLYHCMTLDDYAKRPTATDLVIIINQMITEMKGN